MTLPELSCCTLGESASEPSGLVVVARLFRGSWVIRVLSLESLSVALSVLIWSAAAFTSTVTASAAATESVAFTRKSCRALSATPWMFVVEKPVRATVTTYWPALTLLNKYAPSPSVVVVRSVFSSTLCRATAAPGIAAPDESVTMPRILPNVDCARADVA